eukprot:gene21425-biopygen73
MEPVDGIDHQPGPSRPPKARRLSNLDVADVIITKTITDEMGLYALANEQKLEGKTDLANFVFGKGNKGVNELILQAWKMNDSARKIERGKVTRMERIESAVTGECVNDAYKYVTKEDKEALHSDGHPDLTSATSPRTSKSSKKLMCKKRERSANRMEPVDGIDHQPGPSRPPKARRLSNLDVADVIITKTITDEMGLYALANEQKLEGKTDLANFVFGKGNKGVNELILQAWKMNDSARKIERGKVTRMERIESAVTGECVNECEGQWLVCAKEVLKNNGINIFVFADAVRELLFKGRGKYRNVMITGPANCGKTFLLDPLNKLFETFTNPANSTYAWLGAETKEIIFLNDFRYSNEIMAWKDMLLLLEGQTLHLAAPKTTYAKDILFDKDTPIFATGKEAIKFKGKYNTTDERENEMMSVRWKTFEFSYQIAEQDQKSVPSCPRCFAELVMSGRDA